jgi:hypothetical protein
MPFFLEGSSVGERRVREFRILESGLCSICSEYAAAVDDAHRERARTTLLKVLRRDPQTPSILAVSGGKDSLSSLYLARKVLGLNVIALFYDSGFILPGVAEQLRRVCAALDVELREYATTEAAYKQLEDSVSSALPGGTPPCHLCSRNFFRLAFSVAAEVGTKHVLVGSNHFFCWPEGGQPVGVQARSDSGRKIYVSALPYLLGVTRQQTMRNVEALGATACVSPSGVSTNCRVPELVQMRIGKAFGHVPELEMSSLEILVGHLTREAAAAEIVAKVRASGSPNLQWMVDAFAGGVS